MKSGVTVCFNPFLTMPPSETLKTSDGSKCSRMDQVEFAEDSL